MAQIIQADLANVGVTLTLQPTDRPQLASLQYAGEVQWVGGRHRAVRPGPTWRAVWQPVLRTVEQLAGFKDDQFRAGISHVDRNRPGTGKTGLCRVQRSVLDQSFTIRVATLLPRVATMARVHGVNHDKAYILDATEAWLA